MKIIGLDVGTKRIGVSRADTTTKIAVPEGFVNVNGQEFTEIIRIVNLYNTNIVVVGLPRNNSGKETKQSEYARNFANELVKQFPNLKVYFEDETLTSVEAEARLKNRKRKYEKGDIDAEAATIILQSFLERLLSSAAAGKIIPVDVNSQTIITEGTNPKMKSTKPSTKKGSASRVILKIFLIIICTAIVAGVGIFIWYSLNIKPVKELSCKYSTAAEAANNYDKDPDVIGCEYQKFEVRESESIDTISKNLQAAGLIKSSLAFKIYAKFSGNSSALKSGFYELRSTMDVSEIVNTMVSGAASTNVFNFTLLPGETVADFKKKLVDIGYNATAVDVALRQHYDNSVLDGLYASDGSLSNNSQPLNVQLEGYLYGETYQFYINEEPAAIINTMANELGEVVTGNNLVEKFKARGFSLREGIILASIIQKEAKSADMAGVSMVFQNRLRTGMSLGSDVTATYAADLFDPDRKTLTSNAAILDFDSLYNTRKHTGLTPGPISSPGITALMAVANPDTSHSSDYFFLTGDDGKMYYSSTEAGHEQNIRDYCKTLCSVAL